MASNAKAEKTTEAFIFQCQPLPHSRACSSITRLACSRSAAAIRTERRSGLVSAERSQSIHPQFRAGPPLQLAEGSHVRAPGREHHYVTRPDWIFVGDPVDQNNVGGALQGAFRSHVDLGVAVQKSFRTPVALKTAALTNEFHSTIVRQLKAIERDVVGTVGSLRSVVRDLREPQKLLRV